MRLTPTLPSAHLSRRGLMASAAGLCLVGPVRAQEATPEREVIEMTMGAEDAPITVVEYANFACPACMRFHTEVFPSLRESFIDTGKVRFVHREIYANRLGLWAAMVARCGGEMRYFGLVDLIYERQGEWTRGQDPTAIAESLYAIGRQAGLTNDEMEACVSDTDWARALVEKHQAEADADGVTVTPTFIVNGTMYNYLTYAEFSTILNELLES